MPADTDLAYFAGLFDGEGCVDVRVNRRRNRRDDFNMRIGVYNTDVRVIEWLVSSFGGRVEVRPEKRPQPLYQWRVSIKKYRWLLEAARPYMKVKGEQVDSALRLVDLMGAPGCQRVPEENMQERLRLVQGIRDAKRGVAVA